MPSLLKGTSIEVPLAFLASEVLRKLDVFSWDNKCGKTLMKYKADYSNPVKFSLTELQLALHPSSLAIVS